MAHRNGFDEEKEFWTDFIEAARANAEGVAAYLRQHGVSKKQYYFRFQRLRSEHPEWEDLFRGGRVTKRKKQKPATEVGERATRRKFSAAEKLRILRAVEVAPKGQVASILRREGVYASHIVNWRKELEQADLEPKKRGPKENPLTSEVQKLKAQNERLEKKLEQANRIIELQKKVSEILGVTLEQSGEED
jgi:transposase-like protein